MSGFRLWRKALQDPASHSLNTWEEDSALPLNPTLARSGLDEEEGSLVAWGFLSAMSSCKLETFQYSDPEASHSLFAWLPPQLQRLKVTEADSNSWEDCACVPGLKWLDVSYCDVAMPKTLSTSFPNLETLEVDTHWDGVQAMEELFADTGSNLPRLKNMAIFCENVLPEFQGPSGCRVIAKMGVDEIDGPAEIGIPKSIASQLYSVELFLSSSHQTEVNMQMDVAIFAHCQVLSCIVLNLENFSGGTYLRVTGLESLPASCKVVEFKGRGDDFPCVKLARGWQVAELPRCLRLCRIGCLGYEVPPSESDTPEFWPSGFPALEERL